MQTSLRIWQQYYLWLQLESVLLLSTSMIVRDWRANRQRTVIFLRLTSVLGIDLWNAFFELTNALGFAACYRRDARTVPLIDL